MHDLPENFVPLSCGIEVNSEFEKDSGNLVSHTCFASQDLLESLKDVHTMGSIKGTLTQCRLKICSQRYHNIGISNGIKTIESTVQCSLQVINKSKIEPPSGEEDSLGLEYYNMAVDPSDPSSPIYRINDANLAAM